MNPAMCECLWLTIAVVCVGRLDEEHVCGCLERWPARGIYFLQFVLCCRCF